MTGLDDDRTGNGEPGQQAGPPPFFPGPAARRAARPAASRETAASAGTAPGSGAAHAASGSPLSAPTTTSGASPLPTTLRGSPSDVTTGVEGRVTIEQEVLGKIAALAALEVTGVAAVISPPERSGPRPAGHGDTGPAGGPSGAGGRPAPDEHEVTLDVAIAVEYGCVIRDVADAVKTNVARVAGRMLGARVAAVNVSVGDVRKTAGTNRTQGPQD
ncbi:MAG TPA: Asp23/Gls24 family envelope stress response protein [Spirillospora sp.]